MVTLQAYWYLFVAAETLSWKLCNTNFTEMINSLQQNFLCHRQTILDFLMDYWTFSKCMVKRDLTGIQEMLYVIYIAELGFRVGSRKIIYGQLILVPF